MYCAHQKFSVSEIALFLLLLLSASLGARDIMPLFQLTASASVMDFVVDGNRLYAATDRGSVDIFDLTTHTLIEQIHIDPLSDTRGEAIVPTILSVDRLNGKTLFVTTANSGYRNVWIHEKGHLTRIVGPDDRLSVKEARFIDDNRVIYGTMGYEMILQSLDERYSAYRFHVEQSAFSDIVLSEDKKTMATASESGEVVVIEVENGAVVKVLSSENVDNIYRIAYKKGTIVTAGNDRRVGVYPQEGKPYHIKSDFLVYCAALSPSAETGVYSSGIDNKLQLFKVDTGKETDRLIGHYGIVNAIVFINEKQLYSAGNEKSIFFWQLD